ncbi:meiosis-specific protein ASY2-like [Brassica napus]|uniref:meiosis-specific protein ASY2-like n=1 Tax=Brassica napus TaxID=3708 RepID=UPI0020797CE0|nr:meiosis-specific protein ASY2-like [Brassica napus]
MVMAAEIDVSMSVRAFEELTYLKSMGDGLFSIQMRPNYNVIVGYPNRTNHWQRFYFFVKSDEFAFEDPPGDVFRFLWNPDLEFIANARVVASLAQESWENITVERIRRAVYRISKRDWLSDLLPLVTGKKHRFLIFTRAEQKKINEARKMTTLPDLSAFLGSRLGGPSSNEPILVSSEATREETLTASPQSAVVPDPVVSELSEGSLAPEVVEPEKTKKKGKKRAASGISVSSVEGTSAEAQSNEPSKKKTKEKKRKKFVEEQTEPDEVAEGREIVVHDGSGRGAAARAEGGSNDSPGAPLERKKRKKQSVDHDVPVSTERDDYHASEEREFKYDGDIPLSYASAECAELIRQMRGGPRDMPPVSDLFFKDAYVNADRTKSDGSMNFAIEKYDTALKDTLAQLGKAEKLAQVRGEALTRKSSEFKKTIDLAVVERDQLLAGKKAHKERFLERFGELKDKFRSSHERVKELEREKAVLEAEKATLEEEKKDASLRHMREINRLKESRSFEVTHERVRIHTEMIAKSNRRFNNIRNREVSHKDFDHARLLYSQAFGTKKCLEALKANGRDIPQGVIDVFSEQEKHFELEAKQLDVGEIPKTGLSFSPLLLDSPFMNKHVLAGLYPYGSNAGLVDPGTAVILRTPSSSHGEQSSDRLDDPTPFVELNAAPAANEHGASKETSDNAPQLGGKVVTSLGGTQVGEGVLEISDSSSEDRSERDPVEKMMGPELDDVEKSPGARSEPVETVEATPVDEQTEGISVDPPNSSADVPDGSVPPVIKASEDYPQMLLLFLLVFLLSFGPARLLVLQPFSLKLYFEFR